MLVIRTCSASRVFHVIPVQSLTVGLESKKVRSESNLLCREVGTHHFILWQTKLFT